MENKQKELNVFDKKTNKLLLEYENNNKQLFKKNYLENKIENDFLYPHLDDPLFNIKIANKPEFNENRYDVIIYDIKKRFE